VVQQAQHVVMAELSPGEFPLVGAAAQPPGEGHALAAAGPDGGAGRAGPREGAEEEADGVLHLPVRVEDDLVALGVAETDRQVQLERGPARLIEDATLQAGADDIEFGLRHGALQSQQQPVVEGRRVVQSILI